jgi:hypothetical protein
MKTSLLSLLGAGVLLITTQCAATPEKEAPAKYQSTPSARRAVEREPPAPRNVDSVSTAASDSTL